MMKQVLQSLSSGATEVSQVSCLQAKPRHLLIHTHASLISAGTERTLVDFGKANLIAKARQQPEKVRQVLEKAKTDGVLTTLDAVRSQLDYPLPMGYCNAGTVLDVGAGVEGFIVGDRVASNGQHAEVVCVPQHLCAKIPDLVSDEQAAFTVLGAIALQGIRLAHPTLGETIVVTGLGLVGLLTVQLLRANGCRVLGIDVDPTRLELAQKFGAQTVDLSRGDDPLEVAAACSRGRGVDAVLITASTTSNEPVHQASQMCRKRGRVVLVGVVGLELSRADFYEKELTFQVSCSYGPGRYDPNYEELGHDYPFGFVRWTEQRNLEAVLDLLADHKLDVETLISHRFSIDEAAAAYALMSGSEPSLGIVLQYPPNRAIDNTAYARVIRHRADTPSLSATDKPVLGFIGAGNYARRILMPAFAKTDIVPHTVVSAGGVSAMHAAKKFGMANSSTDAQSVLDDPAINTVVITTRHNSHARFVCDALSHGKHVFVEKPLCLTAEELSRIETVYQDAKGPQGDPLCLMVGFNRRFAPHVRKIRELLAGTSELKVLIMTVNAGAIPLDHWTQDHAIGGGRIIGEACHFIDLLRFLAQAPIIDFEAIKIGKTSVNTVCEDKASITLRFADGSHGTIHYLANGHTAFPKERLDVFCAGRVLHLDNFRHLRAYGWPRFSRLRLWRQDKGHTACVNAFVHALRQGGPAPIPFDEIIEVSRTTIDIAHHLAD
jgi:predicted dehydrogenase/threonine dehydrogenase-like Zn-dependent dehydrogenase